MIWGNDTLIQPPGTNRGLFIGRLDRLGEGIWAKEIAIDSANSFNFSIARVQSGAEGSIWLYLVAADTISIGDTTLVGGLPFLMQIGRTGAVLRTERIGPSGLIGGFDVDEAGRLLIGGTFADSLALGDTTIYSSPVDSTGSFIILYDSSGQRQWVRALAEATTRSIVMHEQVIYMRTSSSLMRLAVSDGAPIWEFPVDMNASGDVVGKTGKLYVFGLYTDTLQIRDSIRFSSNGATFYVAAVDSTEGINWISEPEEFIDDSAEFLPNYQIRGLTPAPDSGVWAVGFWRDSITFQGRQLIAQGGEDVLLLRFTPGGQIDSVITLGSPAHPYPIFALDVTLDSNYLYLGGNFNTSEQIGPDLIRARDTVGYAFDLLLAQYGSCPSATPTWPLDTQFICPGDSLPLLVELSNPAFDYTITWQQNGQDLPNSDSSTWVATQDGIYRPIVRDLVCENAPDTLPHATVEVVDMPLLPSIQLTIFDSLECLTAADSYLWYRNDTLLPYSSTTIPLEAAGNYQVAVIRRGCVSHRSAVFAYVINALTSASQALSWQVVPNPVQDGWRIILPEQHPGGKLYLYDAQGRMVWQKAVSPNQRFQLGPWGLAKGIYAVRWTSTRQNSSQQILMP